MTTKAMFLETYRATLVTKGYAWTADAAKVDGFMEKVGISLGTEFCPWIWNGDISREVWKHIGMKGPMTLKALRALP